jgi:hypothetical protein
MAPLQRSLDLGPLSRGGPGERTVEQTLPGAMSRGDVGLKANRWQSLTLAQRGWTPGQTETGQSNLCLAAAERTPFLAPGLVCTDRPPRLSRKPALRLQLPRSGEGDERGGESDGRPVSASRGSNLQPISRGRGPPEAPASGAGKRWSGWRSFSPPSLASKYTGSNRLWATWRGQQRLPSLNPALSHWKVLIHRIRSLSGLEPRKHGGVMS